MSELRDYSPAQIEEATKWLQKNCKGLYMLLEMIKEDSDKRLLAARLADMYFQLKQSPIPLAPHQFVIGVDYTGIDKEDYIKDKDKVDYSKAQFNLSFWNPHPKGVADELAKDFLITKINQL